MFVRNLSLPNGLILMACSLVKLRFHSLSFFHSIEMYEVFRLWHIYLFVLFIYYYYYNYFYYLEAAIFVSVWLLFCWGMNSVPHWAVMSV